VCVYTRDMFLVNGYVRLIVYDALAYANVCDALACSYVECMQVDV
jgi:hypothetical protein